MVLHTAAPPIKTAPLRIADAADELDGEVARLHRVRRGDLPEPLLWQRPSYRSEVDSLVAQLAPIRSRLGLLSSWQREARRGAALRLAYAIVWIKLGQRRAGEYGPRDRRPPVAPGPLGISAFTARTARR